MPSYTHLQRAEPVLVAHWLLAYVEMILRDASRFRDCAARLNYCPLGSGAVAGATLALDRTIAARELGFTAPTANSIDATSDRDFILEFLQARIYVGIHISAASPKRSLCLRPPSLASSILPRRFRPDPAPCRRRKIPTSPSCFAPRAAACTARRQHSRLQLKGLPLAYNKDMQETQEPAFAVMRLCAADVEPVAALHARASLPP